MPIKIKKFDAAKHLETPEAIAAYLEAALEDDDPAMLPVALGTVARAKGMTELARETGISRKGLYKALAEDGDPKFSTVMAVMKHFGLRIRADAA